MLAAGDEFPDGRQLALRFGHRTTLAVPLLREGRSLGTILVRRTEVRPFEDKHIALLKTFADQAVIAIENARLFNETQGGAGAADRDRRHPQGHRQFAVDVQPVFDAIAESASRLAGKPYGGGHASSTTLSIWRPARQKPRRPRIAAQGLVARSALVDRIHARVARPGSLPSTLTPMNPISAGAQGIRPNGLGWRTMLGRAAAARRDRK